MSCYEEMHGLSKVWISLVWIDKVIGALMLSLCHRWCHLYEEVHDGPQLRILQAVVHRERERLGQLLLCHPCCGG